MVLSLREPFRWACNSTFGNELQNLSCSSVYCVDIWTPSASLQSGPTGYLTRKHQSAILFCISILPCYASICAAQLVGREERKQSISHYLRARRAFACFLVLGTHGPVGRGQAT